MAFAGSLSADNLSIHGLKAEMISGGLDFSYRPGAASPGEFMPFKITESGMNLADNSSSPVRNPGFSTGPENSFPALVAVQFRIEKSDSADIIPDSTGAATGNPSSGPGSEPLGTISISITTDPDNSRIIIGSSTDTLLSPASISGPAGKYKVLAFYPGYIALDHELDLSGSQQASLHFILQAAQPERITAEQAGLQYRPLIPLRDEAEAKAMKDKLTNLAATFTIMPLGQGVLARLILDEDYRSQTNLLIISGAGLTAGTYLLSRILPSRKLAGIKRYNENATSVNLGSQAHNQDVDRQLKEKNDQAYEAWLAANKDRGKVKVKIE